MKIKRTTAVTLLTELGLKTAERLSDKRLLAKLQELPEKLDDEDAANVKDKAAKKLLSAIQEDPEELEEAEILALEEVPAKASKGKATKAKQEEPEDEDEDDDEEADEEESEEDEDEEESEEDEDSDEDEESDEDTEDEEDEDQEESDEDEEEEMSTKTKKKDKGKEKKTEKAEKAETKRKPGQKKPKGGDGTGNVRHTILGKSASSVVQWMGSKGWDFATARKVCDKAGAKGFKDSSIRTALTDCKNEAYARVAELSGSEAKQLKQLAGK